MPATNLDVLLDRLEELRRRFEPGKSLRAEKLLAQLGRHRFLDAASLIRFHEILLFLRAYPHTPAMRLKSGQFLASFHKRVAHLHAAGADLSAFAEPPVSGIAGTAFSAIWGYDNVRYLAKRYPSRVEIDWEGYEGEERIVSVLKSFLPLFEDGAYVVYSVPYLTSQYSLSSLTNSEATTMRVSRRVRSGSIENSASARSNRQWPTWLRGKNANSIAGRATALLRAYCVNSPPGILSTKHPRPRIPVIGTISACQTSDSRFNASWSNGSAA